MSTHPFGRVDTDGNVYCLEAGEERHVGQYADVATEEALAFYVRKFDDINTALSLLERRIASDAQSTDFRPSLDKVRTLVGDEEKIVQGSGADMARRRSNKKRGNKEQQ